MLVAAFQKLAAEERIIGTNAAIYGLGIHTYHRSLLESASACQAGKRDWREERHAPLLFRSPGNAVARILKFGSARLVSGDFELNTGSNAGELTSEVKETALESGADLVGIVSAEAIDSLPAIWVGWKIQDYTKKTKDIMPDAKSIVVIGYHVWDDMLELAIRKGERWVYPGYIPVSSIEQKVCSYIQERGYKTIPYPPLSQKRLAQLAGFGNYGKNALIVNPVYGPWIRLATILTNAEMIPDKPFEQDLCGDCEECIKACPVGALTPYEIDDEKCLVGVHLLDKEGFELNEDRRKYEPSFTKNSHLMCTECQRVCKYGNQDRSRER